MVCVCVCVKKFKRKFSEGGSMSHGFRDFIFFKMKIKLCLKEVSATVDLQSTMGGSVRR